jgi:hypothetical protein
LKPEKFKPKVISAQEANKPQSATFAAGSGSLENAFS